MIGEISTDPVYGRIRRIGRNSGSLSWVRTRYTLSTNRLWTLTTLKAISQLSTAWITTIQAIRPSTLSMSMKRLCMRVPGQPVTGSKRLSIGGVRPVEPGPPDRRATGR